MTRGLAEAPFDPLPFDRRWTRARLIDPLLHVMAGLVPAIHAVTLRRCLDRNRQVSAWMAVTSTAMTQGGGEMRRPRQRASVP